MGNFVLVKVFLNNYLSILNLSWGGERVVVGVVFGIGGYMSVFVCLCVYISKSWVGSLWDILEISSSSIVWEVEKLKFVN